MLRVTNKKRNQCLSRHLGEREHGKGTATPSNQFVVKCVASSVQVHMESLHW